MLHVYAAVAQEERRLISERTRAALQAAKARGVRLGNPAIADTNRQAAASRDEALRPHLEELASRPLRAIAAELETRGIAAPAGGGWNPQTVRRAIKRLGLQQGA
jgi:DNA invertase Pin-like site-specific DNA recombinase